MGKRVLVSRILWVEAVGFFLILASFWLCKLSTMALRNVEGAALIDGWRSITLISLMVVTFAVPVMLLTRRLILKMCHSEDELYVRCAWCSKMRDESNWVSLEEFFRTKFSANTSHGICPECRSKAEDQMPKKPPS